MLFFIKSSRRQKYFYKIKTKFWMCKTLSNSARILPDYMQFRNKVVFLHGTFNSQLKFSKRTTWVLQNLNTYCDTHYVWCWASTLFLIHILFDLEIEMSTNIFFLIDNCRTYLNNIKIKFSGFLKKIKKTLPFWSNFNLEIDFTI